MKKPEAMKNGSVFFENFRKNGSSNAVFFSTHVSTPSPALHEGHVQLQTPEMEALV